MAKICHITSAHTRYDIRIFVKQCVTLARAGHLVSLIVADHLADEIKDGIPIYNVGKARGRLKRMLSTSQKIFHKLLELQPEVVHFHDPELMFIGVKLAKRGFKVIYDVHEDLPKQVKSKYWLPRLIRPVVSKVVELLEARCSKYFSGIVAATPIIAKRFSGYNPNTIVVCNYPLLSELTVAASPWETRQDRLCYIGSISASRGIRPTVTSLAQSKLPLELAGPFSGDVLEQELIASVGGNYVNYHGILGRDEIVQLLQQVKVGIVTLLPTPSYLESLPIKMFEYMLAGIPIVASNFPLWESIILRYKCGVLVDPTKPQQIAEACVQLLHNQAQAKSMGENGRLAVLAHFNWEKESEKLLEFYLFN
jgi:glycosyltransferase involved in cell wall biosynthesis